MKPTFNSMRARLVLSLMLAFSALAFVAFFLQTRTLEQNAEIANWGQRIAAVRLVELYIELSFPGGWQSREGFLYKGSHRFIDGSTLSSLLSDYLPPNTTIRFEVGAPPTENKMAAGALGIFGRPKSPLPAEPSRGVGMPRVGLPFFTANGMGIAVRGEDSSIVGWIHIENGQNAEVLRLNRFRQLFLVGAAGLCFVVITAFGALVLRLTRPVGRIAKAHEREKARNAELAGLSRTDPLTGLLNRRGIDEILVATEGEDEAPSHVAIIDIDHFKAVNDDRGHDEGDRVLTAVAEMVSSGVRRGDLCGRWGGEEFIIVFRGPDDASASAERIRKAVEARAFGDVEAPLRVSVTIGVAPLGNGSFAEAVSAADGAMYIGKREGRNRVVVARE